MLKKQFAVIAKSIWLFPAILFLVVVLLASLRISGTSVGMYHKLLYGTPDKNLIHGEPQPIRSDEWMVSTPLVASQVRDGLARVNPSIGDGSDASMLADVPYRDWSELFKPQNWSFFVLPLEQAFAFKWWVIGYLLVVSVYFLSLTILPGRKKLAVVLSLGFFAAPFLQWWYVYGTLGSIYASIFAAIIFIHLIRAQTMRRKIWLSLALAYTLSSFALILYPPFQIPCALAAAVLCIGYLIDETRPLHWRAVAVKLAPALVSIALTGLVVGAFFLTRLDAINAITGSVYPGHRVVVSGRYLPYLLLDGPLEGQLQELGRAVNYVDNQSEASGFIAIWPYLLIPSVLLLVQGWRKRKRLDYALLLVNGLIVVFAARMLLPIPEIIPKVLFLSAIPHNRLKIGLGVLGLMQLILVIRRLKDTKLRWEWVAGSAGLALVAQLWVGLFLDAKFPLFGIRKPVVLVMALAIGAVVYLVLKRKPIWATGILLLVSSSVTYNVNPLYIGLGELTNSPLVQAAIKDQGGHNNGWVYVGNIPPQNLLVAYGLHSYSGTYPYPQLKLFKQFDPEGKYTSVYNRYAHAIFVVNDPVLKGFKLGGLDTYYVNYEPCKTMFKQRITRIASEVALTGEPCLKQDAAVRYPNATFYIYSVQ